MNTTKRAETSSNLCRLVFQETTPMSSEIPISNDITIDLQTSNMYISNLGILIDRFDKKNTALPDKFFKI